MPLYLNMVAGYCFGIGLTFAGTADSQAKHTILHYLTIFQRRVIKRMNMMMVMVMKIMLMMIMMALMVMKNDHDEHCDDNHVDAYLLRLRENKSTALFAIQRQDRVTLENCLSVMALSLAAVMAGTGDVDCLRVFRELRWRVDDTSSGAHMSFAMAIGE